MKRIGMMGVASLAVTVLVMSILMSGSAHSWDAATHAYIEEQIQKKQGQLDEEVLYNRIYGANALDVFYNNFDSPYLGFHAYLHDTTGNSTLKVWEMAENKDEKAFAYGFVSHNNGWGMDSTAHVSGITFGRGDGYVIAKAKILAAMIKGSLEQLTGPLDDNVVVDICHYFVESGVDFLVRSIDPLIGYKLMAAAENRSDEVPELLVRAYETDNPDLAENVAAAEGNFRELMIAYGWALTQDDAEALRLVSEGMAKVGADYLHLPPEAIPYLVPAAEAGILAAMDLCARDIKRELRASTGWVNGKLSSHGIFW